MVPITPDIITMSRWRRVIRLTVILLKGSLELDLVKCIRALMEELHSREKAVKEAHLIILMLLHIMIIIEIVQCIKVEIKHR